ISPAGPTIGAAIFAHVEAVRGEMQEELGEIRAVGEDDRELARDVARLEKLESALRKEKRRFTPPKERVATLDGLGVRAPRSAVARIDDKKLVKDLRSKKVERWIDRGHELIAEGKAGSALHIARDALAALAPEKQDRAVLLAVAAYEALDRPLLARTFEHRLPQIRKRTKLKKSPKVDNRSSESMEEAELDPNGVRHLTLEQWGAQPKTPNLEAIARFTNLESLTLRGYKLGDLPKSFANLKKLRAVELFECKLVTIPKVLGALPLLGDLNIMQSLHVRSPKKPVRVPPELELRKLRTLELVACGLREVPAFVLRARHLRLLDLTGNRLRALPDAIGALTELGFLRLAENALAVLPDSVRKLRALTFLSLEDNRFTVVPGVLAEMRRLSHLGVGKNPLVKDKAERARAKKMARDVSFT
ncbi:MAG TPA: leucine-rich repeat domain-containing protein, partial [Polyangiaceae bacterium]|nr:leucine-rich repeat domain-containing protein [Polyangiaceae bacterium]